jgi:hypothetical protein
MAKSNRRNKVNEVANKPAGGEVVPDFMKGHRGEGLEGLGTGDYELPRIKLLQALSPEVQDGFGKAGQFFHTILEESFDSPLTIVPVHLSKMYILWRPRVDGGGILARADDGEHWSPPDAKFTVKIDKQGRQATWRTAKTVTESGLDRWGTYDPEDPKSQPAATYMINVVVCLPEFPEMGPAVITTQRSSIRAGRKFAGKLKISELPIFGRVFELHSVDELNDLGQYKGLSFRPAGLVQDQSEFNSYQSIYEVFKGQAVAIKDLEGMQDEDTKPPVGEDVNDSDAEY